MLFCRLGASSARRAMLPGVMQPLHTRQQAAASNRQAIQVRRLVSIPVTVQFWNMPGGFQLKNWWESAKTGRWAANSLRVFVPRLEEIG
jgi:hypothetical protein